MNKPERRPYQDAAVKKLVRLRRAPLVAPMGSGKTRIALDALAELTDIHGGTPTWILCPTNARITWIRQAKEWHDIDPELFVVASGTKQQRLKAYERAHDGTCAFIMTTYSSFTRDRDHLTPHPHAVIMDEPHRVMRNRTKTWEALRSHFRHTPIIFLVDGTPLRRGPQDFYTYLAITQPKVFKSYWRFVNTWCLVIDGFFGKEIVGPKNMEAFKREIWGTYCAYVSEQEAEKYLPKKQRIFVPIEPTAKQHRLIQEIEEQIVTIRDGQYMLVPSPMVGILRERQVLTTPKILNPDWEYGAGLDAVCEHIDSTTHDRPVVFSPFTKGIEHIKAGLERVCNKEQKVHIVKGGMELNELGDTIKAFRESSDDRMLCSLSYAESFEFDTSCESYALGFDWSRDVNIQAEDRLRRLTNTSPKLRHYYFKNEGTIDGHVLHVMMEKASHVDAVTPRNLLGAIKMDS